MKFKIHFTITKDGEHYEDYFIVEGETLEEVRQAAFREEEKRGLTLLTNNLWSEEV